MIHPADERIVVCVEPSVKEEKTWNDVAARNLNIPKEAPHKKAGRMSCPQICFFSRLPRQSSTAMAAAERLPPGPQQSRQR